ncbi:MAG TPA: hypothetical protein VHN58_01205 [Croceicoccus sp.]|nr:hypothetical protein [Croceicoccus sp.]
MAAIVLLLAAQATMVFTRAINWDEFFYFSQVHQYLRGEAIAPLQTIHVHLFRWLPSVRANPVDAIVLARLFMLACEIATIACIILLSERFANRATGVLAALAYLSAGFVMQHGFSFRVDPPTTALLMAALTILARCRLEPVRIALFALAVALAGMFTIKIVLFAPAFAGLAWLRWREAEQSRAMAMRLVTAAAATLALFAVLYVAHTAAIAGNASPGMVSGKGAGVITSAGEAVFFIGIPPYLQMMIKAVSISLVLTGLILIAPFAIWRDRMPMAARIALIGLWLPILTLFFYRNTAPYYYAFVLAPVAVGCVPAIGILLRRVSAGILALCLALLTIPVIVSEDRTTIDNQRVVVEEASRMFTVPVDYFDHNGALAGHVKANGFMTPWGLEGYRAHGRSLFRTIMEQRTVPLLFENDQLLSALLEDERGSDQLFPGDSRVLKENYVRAWGPVWLAGKSVPAGSRISAEVLVPGRYRIEGEAVAIDGEIHAPGTIVGLSRGVVELANSGKATARLIWADVDLMPQRPVPDGRIWIGF